MNAHPIKNTPLIFAIGLRNALKKLIALLSLAMFSTTAFAITDAQLFAYAEANFPGIFTGAATAGVLPPYNYRYYPASRNYLAVDTSGVIYILGPYTGGVVTTVGPMAAYAATITAWEATQVGTGATGGITGGGGGSGTAAQYFTKKAVGNTWTLLYSMPGVSAFTTTSTITASAGGVVSYTTSPSPAGSTVGFIDATGALVGVSAFNTSRKHITLPATFSVGTTWVSDPDTTGQGETNATIVAFNVTRTVPAGIFTDCLQINMSTPATSMTLYLSQSAGGMVDMTGTTTNSRSGSTWVTQLQAGYVANP